ncbi:MAG TPA: sigma 54-interacting transcriptional regulator [Vicinamibacterales bacterium]|nr:sigma 54-interacting transcriptional regulator [Vicinamibacterales bacterium]
MTAPSLSAADGPRVLLVSATGRPRPDLADRLVALGGLVVDVSSIQAALSHLDSRPVDLCVLDLTGERSPGMSVRMLRARQARLRLVGIIDPHEPLAAGEAVQHGLTDVLPWPVADRDLLLVLANTADRVAWPGDPAGREGSSGEPLFAQSAAMQDVLDRAALLAEGRAGVLIVGQAGTGRGLIARTLHRLAPGGTDRPLIHVDGVAAHPQDIERTLFGAPLDRRADKHAPILVGADAALVRAGGGSLYVTNVPELPARVQSALARLIRDREAVGQGRRDVIEIDVRLILVLDDDVDQAVSDGRLQPELHDRVAAGRIDAPALRQRREDVPALAAWLVSRTCRTLGVAPKAFSRSALALIAALPWHGNVPELAGLVESLVRQVSRPVLQIDDVLEYASLDGIAARIDTGMTLRDAKARFERECIAAVLRRHHGRVGDAARALGIQRTNLYRKVRQLNVSRSLLSSRR